MLKIRLTPAYRIKKKYLVFIDSETKKSFSNKRQANEYITKVETEINEALLFVNEYFGIISTFYRTYFLADRDYNFKYNVENNIEFITERLNYIAVHTISENFNTIIFQAINNCFDSLVEICETINKKSRSRYDMLTRRRIKLYKKIITLYKESFETFKLQSIYNNNLKVKTA